MNRTLSNDGDKVRRRLEHGVLESLNFFFD
jgi:hypothetical protein